MKRFVEGMDRGQSTLFPECLEDWICEDNPVRVIDVFVGGLDLAGLRFCGVDPEATGRPSYHPLVLLKLYIYGYLNRVQSSRRLEREACRNAEVMWLTASARANSTLVLAVDTPPMEARAAEVIPCDGERWQYEPKWDGFRCLAFKSGDAIDLRAKSGKPLGRYFPEVVTLLRDISAPQFVVDGELVIESEGRLAFDVLQVRLHPAESRIRKLSLETPARLILFDMLVDTDAGN